MWSLPLPWGPVSISLIHREVLSMTLFFNHLLLSINYYLGSLSINYYLFSLLSVAQFDVYKVHKAGLISVLHNLIGKLKITVILTSYHFLKTVHKDYSSIQGRPRFFGDIRKRSIFVLPSLVMVSVSGFPHGPRWLAENSPEQCFQNHIVHIMNVSLHRKGGLVFTHLNWYE